MYLENLRCTEFARLAGKCPEEKKKGAYEFDLIWI